MPSPDNPQLASYHKPGKKTLQRLRREAGYRSAKDFATVLHIPNSTYARYERAPEGPQCGIPLQAAWAMADELGCTIDLIVGRQSTDTPEALAFDNRVKHLSRSGREMLDDFMRYLEFRDDPNAGQG